MSWIVRYSFDVWGNAEEGYQVNDATTLGRVDIENLDGTLEDFIGILKPWFDPVKVMACNPTVEFSDDDHIVIDLDGQDRKPFIELWKEDE